MYVIHTLLLSFPFPSFFFLSVTTLILKLSQLGFKIYGLASKIWLVWLPFILLLNNCLKTGFAKPVLTEEHIILATRALKLQSINKGNKKLWTDAKDAVVGDFCQPKNFFCLWGWSKFLVVLFWFYFSSLFDPCWEDLHVWNFKFSNFCVLCVSVFAYAALSSLWLPHFLFVWQIWTCFSLGQLGQNRSPRIKL